MGPLWTLSGLAERTLLAWMAEVNGLLVDLWYMPRNVQENHSNRDHFPTRGPI